MKKDIDIPVVKNVYIAVVKEYSGIYKTTDWNAYIINDKDVALEMILIVTRGYDENRGTSTMRHKLENLPPKSYAKIELVQEEVLELNNEFIVTYFEDNKMFDKTFLFRRNTINERALQQIPLMKIKGVIVK